MRSRVWEEQRALRNRASQEVWLHHSVDGQACDFQALDRGSLAFRHEHLDLKVRAFTLLTYGLNRREILEDLTLDRRGCFLNVTGVSVVDDSRKGCSLVVDIEMLQPDDRPR